MRILLVCNPAAGSGRALRACAAAADILRARGADAHLIVSESREHLSRVAAEEGPRVDRLIIAGGDGTLHHAIRDMDLHRTVLGVLPAGSGDDFAKSIGAPADPHRACDAFLAGEVRHVDVGRVNDLRYLGIASLGLDSEVAQWVNEHPRPFGRSLVYLWALLRVLPSYRWKRLMVEVDGRLSEEDIMLAVVANNHRYGGGIEIAPTARLDDQLLDLHVVRRCSKRELLTTLPRAYRGAHLDSPHVWWKRSATFAIDADEPLDIFADGEYVTQTPARFSIEPTPLRVVVPSANAAGPPQPGQPV